MTGDNRDSEGTAHSFEDALKALVDRISEEIGNGVFVFPIKRQVRKLDSYFESDYRYWMYLVISEYFEDFGPVEALVQLIHNFGKQLGDDALVTLPMEGSYSRTRREVLSRPWESKHKARLEEMMSPYLLILDKPLRDFDPTKDEHFRILFPEAMTDAAKHAEILSEIAKEINAGADVFEWRDEKGRQLASTRVLRRIFGAIEAKPNVLGFGLDLKKLVTGR